MIGVSDWPSINGYPTTNNEVNPTTNKVLEASLRDTIYSKYDNYIKQYANISKSLKHINVDHF